jgi:hypothetical protein
MFRPRHKTGNVRYSLFCRNSCNCTVANTSLALECCLDMKVFLNFILRLRVERDLQHLL